MGERERERESQKFWAHARILFSGRERSKRVLTYPVVSRNGDCRGRYGDEDVHGIPGDQALVMPGRSSRSPALEFVLLVHHGDVLGRRPAAHLSRFPQPPPRDERARGRQCVLVFEAPPSRLSARPPPRRPPPVKMFDLSSKKIQKSPALVSVENVRYAPNFWFLEKF